MLRQQLGRTSETNAHNTPISERREREHQQREAEREANRIAEEQAYKAEYEQEIKTAENKILKRQTVPNSDVPKHDSHHTYGSEDIQLSGNIDEADNYEI